MDCAVQVAEHFRAKLASRFDVDEAIELLARRPPHARNTADVVSTLRMVAALRLLVIEKDRLLTGEQHALAAQRAEFHAQVQRLGAELAELQTKLSSLRFLASTLGRAIQARVYKRLARPSH